MARGSCGGCRSQEAGSVARRVSRGRHRPTTLAISLDGRRLGQHGSRLGRLVRGTRAGDVAVEVVDVTHRAAPPDRRRDDCARLGADWNADGGDAGGPHRRRPHPADLRPVPRAGRVTARRAARRVQPRIVCDGRNRRASTVAATWSTWRRSARAPATTASTACAQRGRTGWYQWRRRAGSERAERRSCVAMPRPPMRPRSTTREAGDLHAPDGERLSPGVALVGGRAAGDDSAPGAFSSQPAW